MKKLLLPLSLCCAYLNIYAVIPQPVNSVLYSDFTNAITQSDNLPEGWHSKGIDAKPSAQWNSLFSKYSSDNAYSLMLSGGQESAVFAYTPSEFQGNTPSDQWLYTPEFEVTADPMLITYTVSAVGNTVRNNYSIYISESGPSQENFYEIMGSTITGKGDNAASEIRSFVLDGYQGEKVILAFVNNGNTTGMMGFGEISVAPFYLALDNPDKYRNIIVDEDHTGFTVNGLVATPVNTRNMKAVLQTSAGYEYEYNFSGSISATPSEMTLRFPTIDMMGQSATDYTITITPDYKGAVPAVLSGTINYGEHTYPGVLVLEELTGTWCGYCTYGIGSMEYLQHTYNGTDGLAIGVAVHGGNGAAADPMEIKELMSLTETMARPMGFSGYPHMIVNRSAGGHPAEIFKLCDQLISKGSYANVKISDIVFDEKTREMTVKYDAFLSFDAQVANINALAYVTQNKMSGVGKDWFQNNNLCNYTTEQIVKEVGNEVAPYYSEFINGAPSLMKLEFNDVARYAYPSFYGERMEGEWTKDTAKECEMKFTLPADVTDWRNAEVAIILTNSNTGETIAGDRMQATGLTAVGMIENADEISVSASGNELKIFSSDAGKAELITTDGSKISTLAISAGMNTFTPDAKGLLIVKVNAGSKSKSCKILLI